jgi:hypothetical protein
MTVTLISSISLLVFLLSDLVYAPFLNFSPPDLFLKYFAETLFLNHYHLSTYIITYERLLVQSIPFLQNPKLTTYQTTLCHSPNITTYQITLCHSPKVITYQTTWCHNPKVTTYQTKWCNNPEDHSMNLTTMIT